MKQEHKEILIRDLCSRLPYGIKASYYGADEECETWDEVDGVAFDYVEIGQYSLPIERVKPYLFPLSSMTREQKKYITDKWGINEEFDFEIDTNWGKYFVELGDTVDFINWLNENHFDIYGLIPMELALDATNLKIY